MMRTDPQQLSPWTGTVVVEVVSEESDSTAWSAHQGAMTVLMECGAGQQVPVSTLIFVSVEINSKYFISISN